ncbi:unnamed protein product [Gordionus sp. m RMFG-2023]
MRIFWIFVIEITTIFKLGNVGPVNTFELPVVSETSMNEIRRMLDFNGITVTIVYPRYHRIFTRNFIVKYRVLATKDIPHSNTNIEVPSEGDKNGSDSLYIALLRNKNYLEINPVHVKHLKLKYFDNRFHLEGYGTHESLKLEGFLSIPCQVIKEPGMYHIEVSKSPNLGQTRDLLCNRFTGRYFHLPPCINVTLPKITLHINPQFLNPISSYPDTDLNVKIKIHDNLKLCLIHNDDLKTDNVLEAIKIVLEVVRVRTVPYTEYIDLAKSKFIGKVERNPKYGVFEILKGYFISRHWHDLHGLLYKIPCQTFDRPGIYRVLLRGVRVGNNKTLDYSSIISKNRYFEVSNSNEDPINHSLLLYDNNYLYEYFASFSPVVIVKSPISIESLFSYETKNSRNLFMFLQSEASFFPCPGDIFAIYYSIPSCYKERTALVRGYLMNQRLKGSINLIYQRSIHKKNIQTLNLNCSDILSRIRNITHNLESHHICFSYLVTSIQGIHIEMDRKCIPIFPLTENRHDEQDRIFIDVEHISTQCKPSDSFPSVTSSNFGEKSDMINDSISNTSIRLLNPNLTYNFRNKTFRKYYPFMRHYYSSIFNAARYTVREKFNISSVYVYEAKTYDNCIAMPKLLEYDHFPKNFDKEHNSPPKIAIITSKKIVIWIDILLIMIEIWVCVVIVLNLFKFRSKLLLFKQDFPVSYHCLLNYNLRDNNSKKINENQELRMNAFYDNMGTSQSYIFQKRSCRDSILIKSQYSEFLLGKIDEEKYEQDKPIFESRKIKNIPILEELNSDPNLINCNDIYNVPIDIPPILSISTLDRISNSEEVVRSVQNAVSTSEINSVTCQGNDLEWDEQSYDLNFNNDFQEPILGHESISIHSSLFEVNWTSEFLDN